MIVFLFKRKVEALTNCQEFYGEKLKTKLIMKIPVASYRVSYCTAFAGEAHTVLKSLIKPLAVEMVTRTLGEESKKKLETVQLSNNTVKRLLRDFSADTEK